MGVEVKEVSRRIEKMETSWERKEKELYRRVEEEMLRRIEEKETEEGKKLRGKEALASKVILTMGKILEENRREEKPKNIQQGRLTVEIYQNREVRTIKRTLEKQERGGGEKKLGIKIISPNQVVIKGLKLQKWEAGEKIEEFLKEKFKKLKI